MTETEAKPGGLLIFDAPAGRGTPYTLGPDRIVEGAPRFTSWDLEKTADGRVVAGVWEATPGAWRSAKGGDWEFCHLVSGVVDLIEDGQPPRRLVAGDVFVMRPGFVGTWRVLETARKSFVIYTA